MLLGYLALNPEHDWKLLESILILVCGLLICLSSPCPGVVYNCQHFLTTTKGTLMGGGWGDPKIRCQEDRLGGGGTKISKILLTS